MTRVHPTDRGIQPNSTRWDRYRFKMGKTTKNVLQNTGLLFGSLLLFLLIAEFIVFRFVLPATDVPRNAYIDGVIRHQPGQRGYSRIIDGEVTPYAINSQGWNSGHDHYDIEKPPGVKRVAVIGDSYVEALTVPYDQSFAEQLDKLLNADGERVEIYRYGIAGAPLSQYLHMLEHEVMRYSPDLVIILLIHNDFEESFRFKPGRYTSSFLKLKMDGNKVVGEIEPTVYEEGWLDLLRQSSTFRYFFYQKRLHPARIRRFLFGRDNVYEANVDVDQLELRWQQVEAATDYLFRRLQETSERYDVDLLMVMDANRQAIYAGSSSNETSGASRLNKLAADLAARHSIPFLDLKTAFLEDWNENRSHFEFAHDYHWNQRGHMKAAEAIAGFLGLGWLIDCNSPAEVASASISAQGDTLYSRGLDAGQWDGLQFGAGEGSSDPATGSFCRLRQRNIE